MEMAVLRGKGSGSGSSTCPYYTLIHPPPATLAHRMPRSVDNVTPTVSGERKEKKTSIIASHGELLNVLLCCAFVIKVVCLVTKEKRSY